MPRHLHIEWDITPHQMTQPSTDLSMRSNTGEQHEILSRGIENGLKEMAGGATMLNLNLEAMSRRR